MSPETAKKLVIVKKRLDETLGQLDELSNVLAEEEEWDAARDIARGRLAIHDGREKIESKLNLLAKAGL